MIVFSGPFLYFLRKQISELALKSGLPTISGYREGPEAGGLMSYGPSLSDLWRRAVTDVDKILKGAKPAELPVEQPTKFELIINLKTAKALGLTIPQSLLLRTDQVIEQVSFTLATLTPFLPGHTISPLLRLDPDLGGKRRPF